LSHSAKPQLPRHIAIIMDGNGRWATRRHLPRVAGHSRGVDAVRATIEACGRRGIEYLTLFAFSSENWQRPREEVGTLMRLFVTALQKEVSKLIENGVRLRVVGRIDDFDPELRKLIAQSEETTRHNHRLNLTICASYGGRWDILNAAERVLAERTAAHAEPGPIDEQELRRHLALSFAPDPDLLIRTGGEQRISNFLLWQLAYSEFYFCDTLWPEFNAEALNAALTWYATRERRFGRTSQQLVAGSA
jgi:undecaprenyl diphosphate synthase